MSSHWDVLGLAPGSSVASVQAARRRLAKRAHPDAGGSAAEMQALNAAADAALAELARTTGAPAPAASPPPRQPRPDARWRPRPAPGRRHPYAPGVRHDHPSFTMELLPAEAFEALLVVAAELGDVIDDDPPYRLEVALRGDVRGWCELTLVPDAGASSVSLAVGAEPGYPVPDVEQVRDVWVAALNAL